MPTKVLIVFHSLYTHVYHLAEAVAAGAARSRTRRSCWHRSPRRFPTRCWRRCTPSRPRRSFAHVPVADPHALADADAVILGTPTRYGSSTASMQAFLDATGGLWVQGALVGKVGSAFTSTASQHGGQETTLAHLHTFFYHQGMVVAGVPYTARELLNLDEISGGTPYGATTIAGPRGERSPTANELAIARFQGRHVAGLAAKLRG